MLEGFWQPESACISPRLELLHFMGVQGLYTGVEAVVGTEITLFLTLVAQDSDKNARFCRC